MFPNTPVPKPRDHEAYFNHSLSYDMYLEITLQ